MRAFPLLLIALATTPLAALAADPSPMPPPPVVADGPDGSAEPEVRIVKEGDATREEYRVNGKLYMVKVVPSHGVPYYLMDEDGSGQMREVDPNRRVIIPRWVLMRF